MEKDLTTRSEYKKHLLTTGVYLDIDIKAIHQAFELACKAHEGQVRRYEGVPFVTHPIAISVDLAEKYGDVDLIIAGLLHDTVEDCDEVEMKDIYETFGDSVGYLVDAVTDTTMFFYGAEDVFYADKIEKLLAGGMSDVRVLLLKIGDRNHNLKTLEGLNPTKQVRMAFETQAIYVPLKEILGNGVMIDSLHKDFQKYISDQGLFSTSDLKKHLVGVMFQDFDNESFSVGYENTDMIVRKVSSKVFFDTLLNHDTFGNVIDLVSMEINSIGFNAYFRLLGGAIISGKLIENKGMGIHGFYR